jgi:hypothetical protein
VNSPCEDVCSIEATKNFVESRDIRTGQQRAITDNCISKHGNAKEHFANDIIFPAITIEER